MRPARRLFIAGLLAAAWFAAPAAAAGPGIGECLDCHGDPSIERILPDRTTESLFVDEAAYRRSIHGKGPCTACHVGAGAPHGKLAPASCGRCHASEEKSYAQSTHGLTRAKGNRDVPACDDCHGRHDILRPENPKARTFRLNIVAVCLSCHQDAVIEAKYGLPDQEEMKAYENSVHGMALRRSGLVGTAVCSDCHGNHRILPGDQPRSATHRQNIPTLCGKCHPGIQDQYDRSVHGKGMRGGIAESPVCTDCHGEHRIQKITDPASGVFTKNIPKTCSACHEDEGISTRYALPKKRFSTYMGSFHGVSLQYGMTTAANCASCHGFHEILPSSDPASTVNKANLPATCGKCHPNAGPNFAKGTVHVVVSPRTAKGVFAVRVFYTVFISILVLLFVLHVGLDLMGRRRRMEPGPGKGKE